MRIDNICNLGNSGRNTDAPCGQEILLIPFCVSPQRTQDRVRDERGPNHRTTEPLQHNQSRHSEKIRVLCVGIGRGCTSLRFAAYHREGFKVKVDSRHHARKVIQNKFQIFWKTVFQYFWNRCSVAPVGSNAIGSLQDNLKTSHARSLIQPCYSTCGVFLRTVEA